MRPGARLALWGAAKPSPPLPYDAEVEYLRGDGASWIDAGMKVPSGYWVEATVRRNSTDNIWRSVLGCRTSSGVNDYQLSFQAANVLCRYGTNAGQFSSRITIGTNVFKVDSDGKFYVDGVYQRTLTYGDPNPNLNIYVFAMNQNETLSQVASAAMDILSLKIGGSSGTIRDYIPVRVGTVGYLYDRANSTGGPLRNGLYPNSGTGDFVLGGDVP